MIAHYCQHLYKLLQTSACMTTSATQTRATVKELNDRYVLSPVVYRKQHCSVAWSKKLLNEGIVQHTDTLIENTAGEEFIVTDGPMLFASLATLYDNRNHPDTKQRTLVEQLRRMFRQDLSSYAPFVTSTLTQYRCSYGSDYVKHNAGYEGLERVLTKVHVRGPEECIGENTKKAQKVLLGTSDPARVNTIMEWTTGRKPFLLRLHPRKREMYVVEGVLALYQSPINDEFYINACYCQKGISRGVSRVRSRSHEKLS